jgi:transcription antitermination protein NusB
MASNRHLGRIIALQTLYEQDFRREAGDASFDLEEVLDRNITRYQKMVDDKLFIEALVRGVTAQETELDKHLQPIAPEWPIDQIARMDRVTLRMGLYELLHNTDVPPKVVINEAVELAKAFGGENSSKFINGVLGTVMRKREPSLDDDAEQEVPAETTKTAKAPKPAKPDKTTEVKEAAKTKETGPKS